MTALPPGLRSALARTLDVYRGRSTTTVNLTPVTGIGVGNMMSFWLWAHAGRMRGLDRAALKTAAMDDWLAVFPSVRELLVDRSQLRFGDARVLDWAQTFTDFDRAELESFVAEHLLSTDALRTSDQHADDGAVTINVRRGDYYSAPKWRGLYGFDISSYLAEAMTCARRQASVDRLVVVSDDIEWCRLKLPWLSDHAPVEWTPPGTSPVDHLRRLSSSRRLILANSSFSYWSAYISNVRFGDNHASVIAPRFHRREINDGRAWQLDPQWTVVEDIPGGWDA